MCIRAILCASHSLLSVRLGGSAKTEEVLRFLASEIPTFCSVKTLDKGPFLKVDKAVKLSAVKQAIRELLTAENAKGSAAAGL